MASTFHVYARNGNLQACQLLINQGANINALNINHDSPLYLACLYSH